MPGFWSLVPIFPQALVLRLLVPVNPGHIQVRAAAWEMFAPWQGRAPGPDAAGPDQAAPCNGLQARLTGF